MSGHNPTVEKLATQIEEAREQSYTATVAAKEATIKWAVAVETATELGQKAKATELGNTAAEAGVATMKLASAVGDVKALEAMFSMIIDIIKQHKQTPEAP